MRHFIVVNGTNGPVFRNFSGTIEQLREEFSEDRHVLAVEVETPENHVLPTEDDLDEDTHIVVVELTANSSATHLDLAGVQRDAGGHPIDATPGSYDAARTGMVHDLGAGTVRNTNSPEPTASTVVDRLLGRADEEELEPAAAAPQEDPATHRGSPDDPA